MQYIKNHSLQLTTDLETGNVEAIANGIAFEALSRKGLRKRYLIESINSSFRESNGLYYFDDRSELVLHDEGAGPLPGAKPNTITLTNNGLGGLESQVAEINKRLCRLIGLVKGKRIPGNFRRSGGILLWGPNGTGKSLLIRRISECPWRKVLRFDRTMLSASNTRNQATFAGIFTEAIAQHPSIIILDDIHLIAPSSQQQDMVGASVADLLAKEMERLCRTKVLVLAAATSPTSVDKTLRCLDRLEYEIEIPIPSQEAREKILKVVQEEMADTNLDFDSIAKDIGDRTHGFVGRDLQILYRVAQEHASERYLAYEWSAANSGHDGEPQKTFLNGSHRTRPSVSTIGSYDVPQADSHVNIELTIGDFEQALLEVRPTAMKEVSLETPKVQWSEIGGSREIQTMLTEIIEWPLKWKDLVTQYKIRPEKGILFYGPPGCSKTLTAKAIATSSGLNFLAVKGAELTSMYVGESERAVREVFRKARVAAPSIIFFDEIDSIAGERDNAGTSGLNVLTTLLNEMDGIESLKGVLVIAATNRPEALDNALLRPGRFDKLLYIGPPTEVARREIFAIRLKDVPIDDNVDFSNLAGRSDGFSGAEIIAICNDAIKHTMRRNISMREQNPGQGDEEWRNVTNEDLDRALAAAVKRITPEMIHNYEQWRSGLKV